MTESDFNMLCLEAPQGILQIANGEDATEEIVEIPKPAS